MSPRARVAVTGVGVKSPGGTDVPALTATIARGRSTAATVAQLVDEDIPVTFACRVPDFDLAPYLSVRESNQLDRAAMLAVTAAADAVADAGLVLDEPERVGVAVGIGAAGIAATERTAVAHHANLSQVPAFTVPRIMANSSAGRIAIRLGARGSALTYAMACASGAAAIGEAMRKIQYGEADVVVAGGTEASISPGVVAAFARIGAMSARNDEPAAACRPFDAGRDGFVMGEGAAFLTLENWAHAQARGARIIGELLGYGSNCDAYHVVASPADGAVAAACIRQALADADLSPADIGHINAHGTSTPLNDAAEALAIVSCFGESGPPVTAPKGVLGHSLGASGALEAVISLTTAASGQIPPVANFETGQDATKLLDVVAGGVRVIPQQPVLTNSFGFGGHNVSLVFAPC